jgi:hypothetical protein
MIHFEQTKSTKLFSKNAKHHDGFDPPRCILATASSPSCGMRLRSEPPPRRRALSPRSPLPSRNAWNPGVLCPPDTGEASPATKGAEIRHSGDPFFISPRDFALDFGSPAPQSYLFRFSSAVGSVEGSEELRSYKLRFQRRISMGKRKCPPGGRSRRSGRGRLESPAAPLLCLS